MRFTIPPHQSGDLFCLFQLRLTVSLYRMDKSFIKGFTMQNRESLKGRLGFLLLSAGCAIGLGNVWRFPYITGKYGGGAFVLIYLFFLILIGLPVMVIEFSLGRASRKNIAGALDILGPRGNKFRFFGPIAIIGNYILMMFYTTIAGWLFYYFVRYATIGFTESSEVAFQSLQANVPLQIGAMVLMVVLGFFICAQGLEKSVEKASKVMMGFLFAIMIVLVINSALLPGAKEGLSFYLVPDFSRMSEYPLSEVLFSAMGQAFFTLSVGMGGMTIFGSYIDKKKSLTGESIRIIGLDTLMAIMAGLIIFPACFSYNVDPSAGPGLLFISLPSVFAQMKGGKFWGSLFFLFMNFAALTTLIAVFENIIAYWIDNHGWTRRKAAWVNAVLIIIGSLPCILGFNILSGFQPFGPSTCVLDLEDFIISNTIMPLGSLLFVIFCTSRYGWGWDKFIKEANTGDGLKFPSKVRFYVAYILPLIIIAIFIKGYFDVLL